MTCDTASLNHPLPKTSGIERIQTILASNSMPVREPRLRMRDMMDALQPLSIDGNEIGTDMIVAELVTYATDDQLSRETATWTLKKSVFGEFESSMTPIPKYCFKNGDTRTAVMIHSIPRFSLDDILNRSEKDFSSRYTYDKLKLYADWIQTIISRVGRHAPTGKHRLLRSIIALPKYLFPMPPHISQQERATLAARILRIVARHHNAGIYHDRISERTIFFPTPYQPLVMSNYSGVPGAMLTDIIPAELLADDADKRYGPHYRDIYCMALISYRIITGERIDGKLFALESPRPVRIVLDALVHNASLASEYKNLSEIMHTSIALYRTINAVVRLLPSLFSERRFVAWRKINRATGRLWRSIPFIGPFADIFLPTRCAATLRYVLDKNWHHHQPSRKNIPLCDTNAHFPDIAILTGVFKDVPSRKYYHFESALKALISDSGHKRMAFGSLMESRKAPCGTTGFAIGKTRIGAGSATGIAVITLLLLLTINRHSRPVAVEKSSSPPPSVIIPMRATIDKSPVFDSLAIVAAVLPPVDNTADTSNDTLIAALPLPVKPVSLVPEKKRGFRTIATAATTTTTIPTGSATTASRKRATASALKKSSRKALSSLPEKQEPATNGSLVPATGFRGVFIVTGVIDSCNPGRLHFQPESGTTTMIISQFPSAPLTLYMVRRLSTGFSSCAEFRLCRTGKCDPALYYKAVGVSGIGAPVFVKSGDAISPDKNGLQRFVKARLSLRGR